MTVIHSAARPYVATNGVTVRRISPSSIVATTPEGNTSIYLLAEPDSREGHDTMLQWAAWVAGLPEGSMARARMEAIIQFIGMIEPDLAAAHTALAA